MTNAMKAAKMLVRSRVMFALTGLAAALTALGSGGLISTDIPMPEANMAVGIAGIEFLRNMFLFLGLYCIGGKYQRGAAGVSVLPVKRTDGAKIMLNGQLALICVPAAVDILFAFIYPSDNSVHLMGTLALISIAICGVFAYACGAAVYSCLEDKLTGGKNVCLTVSYWVFIGAVSLIKGVASAAAVQPDKNSGIIALISAVCALISAAVYFGIVRKKCAEKAGG